MAHRVGEYHAFVTAGRRAGYSLDDIAAAWGDGNEQIHGTRGSPEGQARTTQKAQLSALLRQGIPFKEALAMSKLTRYHHPSKRSNPSGGMPTIAKLGIAGVALFFGYKFLSAELPALEAAVNKKLNPSS